MQSLTSVDEACVKVRHVSLMDVVGEGASVDAGGGSGEGVSDMEDAREL